MRVAILGTGKMGGAILKRLSESGHELVLWNRTRSRAEALHVGKVASTPAEAVRDADVVISILTDANAVKAAYLGENGAAAGAKNQVFVEMSTAGPDVIRELRPAIERAGAKFVECPVIGSLGAIESGKAILLAAGDDEAFERARPVLERLGEVRRMKDAESAAKLKLVANTALTAVSALAAELLAAGKAAGLEPQDVFPVLTRIAPVLEMRKSGYLDHRFQPVTFSLRDAAKDLRLATEVFAGAGADVPIARLTRELFEEAAKTAGDEEMSAIVTVYEKPASAKRG